MYLHEQGGLRQCGQARGSIFRDFVRTSFMNSLLWAAHKGRPQSGERGFLRCGHPHFLVQKTPEQGGRGLSQVGHFSDKEWVRGQFLRFYTDGPLM